ncbi:MAG TPA: hypothetical protein VFQ62_12980 [Methylomirabilota bacterium]|nr:hypothetical protein [Methylomirabilota bacterium]
MAGEIDPAYARATLGRPAITDADALAEKFPYGTWELIECAAGHPDIHARPAVLSPLKLRHEQIPAN